MDAAQRISHIHRILGQRQNARYLASGKSLEDFMLDEDEVVLEAALRDLAGLSFDVAKLIANQK